MLQQTNIQITNHNRKSDMTSCIDSMTHEVNTGNQSHNNTVININVIRKQNNNFIKHKVTLS